MLKTAKISIALVRCMLIILSCSSEIYIFVFMLLFLEVINLCNCNMYICKNTSLLTGGSSTHKTSAGARTGVGRFVKRFFNTISACQTSYDVRPGTVRCPVGHRPMFYESNLESYDNCFIQKSSGARPMCANAGRAPSGHRTVPGRCHFTLNDPTKRRTGAVEF